jgi:hypothetical protein
MFINRMPEMLRTSALCENDQKSGIDRIFVNLNNHKERHFCQCANNINLQSEFSVSSPYFKTKQSGSGRRWLRA